MSPYIHKQESTEDFTDSKFVISKKLAHKKKKGTSDSEIVVNKAVPGGKLDVYAIL